MSAEAEREAERVPGARLSRLPGVVLKIVARAEKQGKATKAPNAGREEVKAPVFAAERSQGPQDQRVQLARCGIHAQGTRIRLAEADRERICGVVAVVPSELLSPRPRRPGGPTEPLPSHPRRSRAQWGCRLEPCGQDATAGACDPHEVW